MSLRIRIRCTLVVLGAWATAAGVAGATRPAATPTGFEDAVVWLAAWAVIAGTGWLALLATAVAAQASRASAVSPYPFPGCPALWRRVVLALCGAAVVAGTAAPALASCDPDRSATLTSVPRPTHPAPTSLAVLRTLPMPSRPAGLMSVPAPGRPAGLNPAVACPAVRSVVVRPGDSLWRLAEHRLPGAGDGSLARYVEALYLRNRSAIGADPDLIRAGSRLVLPFPASTPPTDEDRR